jgi:hypothetical protein
MSIETLGEAWSLSWRLHIRCERGSRIGPVKVKNCEYRGELDMETLLCTRGHAFPLSMLASRLKCPRCRGIRITIIFEPPSTPARAGMQRAR